MPKCAIRECQLGRDPDGGELCVGHQKWTAPLMRQCAKAIEKAIADEDGLGGLEGETLLRALGHWPLKSKGEAVPAPAQPEPLAERRGLMERRIADFRDRFSRAVQAQWSYDNGDQAGLAKSPGSSLSEGLKTLIAKWRESAAETERVCRDDAGCTGDTWESEVAEIRRCCDDLEALLADAERGKE